MTKTYLNASLVLALALAAAVPARASAIAVTFTQPQFNVIPGDINIAVLATLTNTDPVNTIFINSDTVSLPSAVAVNDEFFANVPLFLNPFQASAPIELF